MGCGSPGLAAGDPDLRPPVRSPFRDVVNPSERPERATVKFAAETGTQLSQVSVAARRCLVRTAPVSSARGTS